MSIIEGGFYVGQNFVSKTCGRSCTITKILPNFDIFVELTDALPIEAGPFEGPESLQDWLNDWEYEELPLINSFIKLL